MYNIIKLFKHFVILDKTSTLIREGPTGIRVLEKILFTRDASMPYKHMMAKIASMATKERVSRKCDVSFTHYFMQFPLYFSQYVFFYSTF